MIRLRRPLIAMGLAVALIAASALIKARPVLVWNASASVPTGLYLVQSRGAPAVGDLVVFEPPPPLRDWLVERSYLGTNVPLIKPVAALPGQRVCRCGVRILIDGVVVATAKNHDRMGRPLPVWQGCLHLTGDQIFVLNAAQGSSLDSRYFGPLPQSTIVGRAVPLWTREN